MLLAGAVRTGTITARVAGDPLTLMVDRHSAVGGLDFDFLLYQVVRDGVIVLVVLDVVIDMYPCFFDVGVLVRLGRQGPQRRFIQLFELAASCAGEFFEGPLVQGSQGKEGLMAQVGHDPAFDDLYRHLGLGFASRRLLLVSLGLYGRAGTMAHRHSTIASRRLEGVLAARKYEKPWSMIVHKESCRQVFPRPRNALQRLSPTYTGTRKNMARVSEGGP